MDNLPKTEGIQHFNTSRPYSKDGQTILWMEVEGWVFMRDVTRMLEYTYDFRWTKADEEWPVEITDGMILGHYDNNKHTYDLPPFAPEAFQCMRNFSL